MQTYIQRLMQPVLEGINTWPAARSTQLQAMVEGLREGKAVNKSSATAVLQDLAVAESVAHELEIQGDKDSRRQTAAYLATLAKARAVVTAVQSMEAGSVESLYYEGLVGCHLLAAAQYAARAASDGDTRRLEADAVLKEVERQRGVPVW